MMFEGVFERFPDVHFGGGDARSTRRGGVSIRLTRPPSTFVHKGGNVFVGCEPNERLLGHDLVGDDVVMYASDYPHWDSDYPESLQYMRTRDDLTEAQRYGVLYGAASRFYGRA